MNFFEAWKMVPIIFTLSVFSFLSVLIFQKRKRRIDTVEN